MSFLKIGDRAAGAIKSGGTTRRAAKMVTLDIDHPDIEEFIEWKVKEERKVAALAVGSKLCRKHLKNVLQSCWDWDDEENRFNIHSNKKLRKAVREAVRDFIPENYLYRIIQLGTQGVREIEFEEYDTNWTSEAYQTVSGQNSNNSVRLTNDFLKAVERRLDVGPHLPHQRQSGENRKGPRFVGEGQRIVLGVGRSRCAVRHHGQRVAYLPGRRPHQRVQSLLGIHVSGRHRVQPRFHQPDPVL